MLFLKITTKDANAKLNKLKSEKQLISSGGTIVNR